MKYILLLTVLVYTILCNATVYKHIYAKNGVSNQKTHQIQKDNDGFMWFLNADGINRYDGKRLKYYRLWESNHCANTHLSHAKLFFHPNYGLWVTTDNGCIFSYNDLLDTFELVYNYKNGPNISFFCLDEEGNLWLADEERLLAFHTASRILHQARHPFMHILDLIQIEKNDYFLATEQGLFSVRMNNYMCDKQSPELSSGKCMHVNRLLYNSTVGKLIIADSQTGICIYDTNLQVMSCPINNICKDSPVSCMKILSEDEILIATDGTGIYKMSLSENHIVPYLQSDLGDSYSICSNRIMDLYVDELLQVWIADYPDGITVFDKRDIDGCKWYRYKNGDNRSLINNRVNAVMQDSEGDLWFATDKGICCFLSRNKEWKHIDSRLPCCIFTSICEVAPGEIYVGNYIHGIYRIQKKEMIVGTQQVQISSVTSMARKNRNELYIGTTDGLLTVNLTTGKTKRVSLTVKQPYIHSLFMDKNNVLYVGTEGYGLLSYKEEDNMNTISEDRTVKTIYTIFTDEQDHLLVCGERMLFHYDLYTNCHHSVISDIPPIRSGVSLGDGKFLLGTLEGVVEYDKHLVVPINKESFKLYLDELCIHDKKITVDIPFSPLEQAIDRTHTLTLKHHQNTFSFTVNAVDYSTISNVNYVWRVNDGSWNELINENIIRLSDLSPGEYHLDIRALAIGNGSLLAHKELFVIIRPSFWRTKMSYVCYALFVVGIIVLFVRIFFVWQDRNLSREKMKVFVNTVQNISTPLTLIKMPLENICAKSSSDAVSNVLYQIKRVDSMLSNLTSIGQISSGDRLVITENELFGYLKSVLENAKPFAERKGIRLSWADMPFGVSAWFDEVKLTAILQSLLIKIIDNTDMNGEVMLVATCDSRNWKIELNVSGAKDIKKRILDRRKYVESDSVDTLGWLLLHKLIRLHKGKLLFNSQSIDRTVVTLVFPILSAHQNKVLKIPTDPFSNSSLPSSETSLNKNMSPSLHTASSDPRNASSPDGRVLVLVEEKDDLRNYLFHVLSGDYHVLAVSDTEAALDQIWQNSPDIVLSNAVLAENSVENFCLQLKTELKTAHIPILLLVDPIHDYDGFHRLADRCVKMPLNISFLKIEIENLIANRDIVRRKYIKLVLGTENNMDIGDENVFAEKDQGFMSRVRKLIDENMSSSEFTVDDLSSKMHMSRSSLYYQIKAITHQTPQDYIKEIRMKKALVLLLSRKYSVSEVADMVGFSDPKYFRYVFKKHYGDSPTKFINNL